jgi:DNA invertase Pin-like site-specific DNA recombinase
MTQNENDHGYKIGAHHIARSAFVYVRQSTTHQVRSHLESQRRQYDLVGQICRLGWPSERVVVVDEDQGKSGASAGARAGFGRLVAAVGRSEAGIVSCLEMSRLARNNVDWHQLVYLCRWTDTLIADETGIYNPSLSTDRMVLGIRGQISEIELDNSIHRMVEARWHKARRGELNIIPPAGYEVDDQGLLAMTSDEAVSNAIRLVFSKFNELGAARRVMVWWREQGLKFPVRRIATRKHPIVWVSPEALSWPCPLRDASRRLRHAEGRSLQVVLGPVRPFELQKELSWEPCGAKDLLERLRRIVYPLASRVEQRSSCAREFTRELSEPLCEQVPELP